MSPSPMYRSRPCGFQDSAGVWHRLQTRPVHAEIFVPCSKRPERSLLGYPWRSEPPWIIALHTPFTAIHGLFQHCNVRIRIGPLNWFFSMAEIRLPIAFLAATPRAADRRKLTAASSADHVQSPSS